MKILRFFILLFMIGCSSSETDNPNMTEDLPMEENMAPNMFSLIDVLNNSENVDLLPSFSWETATDPDGDSVTYEFILDTNPEPSTIIADNLDSPSFLPTSKLIVDTKYYWKVIAIDENQNRRESSIATFATRSIRLSINQIVESAAFPERSNHTMITFDNKIWVIGGAFKNDIWSSVDGIVWNLVTAEAPFSRREFHTSVVFNNKIWVIAGNQLDENETLVPANDVWSSLNGVDWTLETDNAEFSPRWLHSSLVYDDKIWVINGFSEGTLLGDIWYSSNGKQWNLATNNSNIDMKVLKGSYSLDNKMWAVGGNTSNSVYNSLDGINWEVVTENAVFSPRSISASVVYDDRMWMFGGETSSGNENDIWYSSDGLTWFMAETSPSSYSNRFGHKVEVFNNKLFLSGGRPSNGIGLLNDIWEITLE